MTTNEYSFDVIGENFNKNKIFTMKQLEVCFMQLCGVHVFFLSICTCVW